MFLLTVIREQNAVSGMQQLKKKHPIIIEKTLEVVYIFNFAACKKDSLVK
jgi:hypothetical protein